MILKCEPSGEGTPLFFLHGFLGSGENWKGVARKFQSSFLTLCPDARNHGGSPHSDKMDYSLMASDLIETADSLGLDDGVFLGHSMGGKTVMEAALTYPDRVKALIVVDIAPAGFPPKHTGEIEALIKLDIPLLKTRQDAMDALAAAIPDRMMRGFFLKNLVRTENKGFRWRVNMPGIVKNYENIWEGIPAGRTYDGPVLFIRGGESNYIEEEKDSGLIRSLFPQAEIKIVQNAGHWVHVDQPAELIKTVNDFLETSNL